MDGELTAMISQFGAAGLMGLLWIAERRHAALRERQLTEAHRQLISQEHESAALLGIVRDNTRAIVTLEQTQRRLMHAVERLVERMPRAQATQRPGQAPRNTSTAACNADAA